MISFHLNGVKRCSNFFAFLVFLFAGNLTAQEQTPQITFSGYVEPYYSFDLAQPSDNYRPGFLYSHNRHNEVAINLGLIKLSAAGENYRGNVALAAGTYINANYSAEPGVLKNIYEMNAGVRLSKKQDLWLDAGVFGSHIGFESAIGKDCATLTRSIAAETSPYFESGAKLSYTSPNQKWMLVGLVLNGWQRIQRVSGNSLPSFGTQIQYKPAEGITLNSSSFIGTDKPDTSRQMRYFHDFYGIFQLNEKWTATVGFDAGWEQSRPDSDEYNTWINPVAVLQFNASDKVRLAARAEYMSDEAGVLVYSPSPDGFKVLGLSLNLDYELASNCLWRIEGRLFNSKDEIFVKKGVAQKTNAALSTSIALSF